MFNSSDGLFMTLGCTFAVRIMPAFPAPVAGVYPSANLSMNTSYCI